MSIDTRNIRANGVFIENFGKNNTMTNGPEWQYPTTYLIKEAELAQTTPLVWGLSGSVESKFHEFLALFMLDDD